MTTFLSIVLAIASVVLIISVSQQESEQVGLGTLQGDSGESSQWGANRGRSRKDQLKRITTICGVVFMLAALLLTILH